jgi:hypothetical protein
LGSEQLTADVERALEESEAPLNLGDEWTADFAHKLQLRYSGVCDFLQSYSERVLPVAADINRHIERLQAKAGALTTENALLREQLSARPRSSESVDTGEELSSRYSRAMDEIRELNARSSELRRQLQVASARPRDVGPSPQLENGGDWESQKLRLLAELESNDKLEEAVDRRLRITDVTALTDRIIADKDREIEDLRHLLDAQSGSLGSVALGAASLEHVFDQDDTIREERQRLQQVQNELHEKMRQAEVEHSMERARLARREVEVEEQLHSGEPQRAAADADANALAPTGRPVRGRWRAKLGLADAGT